MKLKDKVAIVTGAAQGIGEAIAKKFASEGASVAIADLNVEKAVHVAEEIKSLGGVAIAIKVDVVQRKEVQDMVSITLENLGGLHILVNNAGVVRYASLLEMTEHDWDLVVDVNLKGVFNCTQTVLPYMIKQRYGKIINMSSIAAQGHHGRGGLASYAAAKAGVIQLTKATAREVGEYNINVNCICPGLIVTPLSYAPFKTQEEAEKSIQERNRLAVLGRAGTPEEVANLALFLASDDSAFITGQAITIDGGRTDGM
jgi:3-oxoacyl-[acyl-carrier protein] reductase